MALPLTQELLLIALDDVSGKRRKSETIDYGLAGAALLELLLAERVTVEERWVVVVRRDPIGDAVLDEALTRIAEDKPRRAKSWVNKLHRGTTKKVAAQLVDAGIIREEKQHVLGFVPVTRHPAVDARPESEVRRRLDAAVVNGFQPDQRTAALVALIGATELVRAAFPGHKPRDLKARIKEISAGNWASEAVRKAISDIRTATTAAAASAAAGSTS